MVGWLFSWSISGKAAELEVSVSVECLWDKPIVDQAARVVHGKVTPWFLWNQATPSSIEFREIGSCIKP